MAQAGTTDVAASAPHRIAVDTSCVVNLLSQDEAPNAALLSLFRFAMQGRTTITVTPIVGVEVPGHQEGDMTDRALNRKFIRERIGMFAV